VNNYEKHKQELSESLSEIAEDVTQLVIREQQVMNEDFKRMHAILKEAAGNLRECFNDLRTQFAMQSEHLRLHPGVKENEQSENGNAGITLSGTAEIDAHISKAVRSLQFEDIMQQMINHSRRRAEEIERLFVVIAEHLHELQQNNTDDPEQIIHSLNNCIADIDSVKKALNLENPVTYKSLQQGDIELF